MNARFIHSHIHILLYPCSERTCSRNSDDENKSSFSELFLHHSFSQRFACSGCGFRANKTTWLPLRSFHSHMGNMSCWTFGVDCLNKFNSLSVVVFFCGEIKIYITTQCYGFWEKIIPQSYLISNFLWYSLEEKCQIFILVILRRKKASKMKRDTMNTKKNSHTE